MCDIPESAIEMTAQHLRDILSQCVDHSDQHAAAVVFRNLGVGVELF